MLAGEPRLRLLRVNGLRVCSIIRVLRKMKYETQAVSQRHDGRAVGSDRASAAPSQPAPPAWPAPQDRVARGRQRVVLPYSRRLYLAGTAPRPAPVENRLQLFPRVGPGRHLAEAHRHLPPPGPRQSWTGTNAQRRRHRQPRRSRPPKGARNGARTGARRSRAASVISS